MQFSHTQLKPQESADSIFDCSLPSVFYFKALFTPVGVVIGNSGVNLVLGVSLYFFKKENQHSLR